MSRTSTASSSPGDRRGAAPGVPERPEEVRATLRRLGVVPSRGLGQSFLVDRFVADALAALAEPGAGRPVYEIGGGLGLVTQALVGRGVRELTVVERDRRLARHLAATFGPAVRVLVADARDVAFPSDATVVGSLPFSSGTAIVLRLLARRVVRLAALLQKEVAERFAAEPGGRAYGRPTIVARYYGVPELLREVPASAFYPEPRVSARLWSHTARAGPLPLATPDRLEEVVRRLFAQRRKQLGNLLPRLRVGDRTAAELADAASWPDDWARRRPEELPPEAYVRLAGVLEADPRRPSARP